MDPRAVMCGRCWVTLCKATCDGEKEGAWLPALWGQVPIKSESLRMAPELPTPTPPESGDSSEGNPNFH